jgi:hypothetical protein
MNISQTFHSAKNFQKNLQNFSGNLSFLEKKRVFLEDGPKPKNTTNKKPIAKEAPKQNLNVKPVEQTPEGKAAIEKLQTREHALRKKNHLRTNSNGKTVFHSLESKEIKKIKAKDKKDRTPKEKQELKEHKESTRLDKFFTKGVKVITRTINTPDGKKAVQEIKAYPGIDTKINKKTGKEEKHFVYFSVDKDGNEKMVYMQDGDIIEEGNPEDVKKYFKQKKKKEESAKQKKKEEEKKKKSDKTSDKTSSDTLTPSKKTSSNPSVNSSTSSRKKRKSSKSSNLSNRASTASSEEIKKLSHLPMGKVLQKYIGRPYDPNWSYKRSLSPENNVFDCMSLPFDISLKTNHFPRFKKFMNNTPSDKKNFLNYFKQGSNFSTFKRNQPIKLKPNSTFLVGFNSSHGGIVNTDSNGTPLLTHASKTKGVVTVKLNEYIASVKKWTKIHVEEQA